MLRCQHVRTILVGDQVLVERRQQVRVRRRLSAGRPTLVQQILPPAERFAQQLPVQRPDTAAGLPDGQPRPPDEIVERRRRMAAEITKRQQGQRLLFRQIDRLRHPFRQQRIGRFSRPVGTAANHAVRFGVHHQTIQPRCVDGHSGSFQLPCDLLPREVVAPSEYPFQQPAATQVVPLVQPAAVAFGERRIGGADPPCRQVQHPPHVLRRDEMPRRPHDVHTQDATFAQRLLHGRRCGRAQPQRDGPFGRTVLLRLHHAHPADQLGRIVELRRDELLRVQTDVGQAVHRNVPTCRPRNDRCNDCGRSRPDAAPPTATAVCWVNRDSAAFRGRRPYGVHRECRVSRGQSRRGSCRHRPGCPVRR